MSDSEDDWVDSDYTTIQQNIDDTRDSFVNSVAPSNGPDYAHSNYDALPEKIKLVNFLSTDGIATIYRCEPVNKQYPTVDLGSMDYKHVLLTMALFHNGCESVFVRFPDLKDKTSIHRSSYGLWVDAKQDHLFRIKKKATDLITKENTAFRLGGDFKFHTNDMEPRFIIIATPFENGVFLKDKAIRTCPFFVKSKRQERHLSNPAKKRKKEVEVQKILTDINTVETQKEKLQMQRGRLRYEISMTTRFFEKMYEEIGRCPDACTRIALEHAFRPLVNKKQRVSL